MSRPEQVLRQLTSWRHRFETGQLRPRGLRQPRLRASERFAVRIPSVGVHEQDLSIPMSHWRNAPGPAVRGWTHAPLGALYVTDERCFVAGNHPTDIRREWSWAGVAAVTTLPVPVGVAIRLDASSPRSDVVGSEWNPYVLDSRPTPTALVVNWLKVVAAFAAHQGSLETWFEQLRPEVD